MKTGVCFAVPVASLLLPSDRIRVWESLFADMATPTFEIIHSQDFARCVCGSAIWGGGYAALHCRLEFLLWHGLVAGARYLTPFKTVWDPKDEDEGTLVCGR